MKKPIKQKEPAAPPRPWDPPPPDQCATAPSTYMNLPPMRAGLVKWAKTVDLTDVKLLHITLQK